MIRIFLPLVLALIAGFGPWTEAGTRGHEFAQNTVECFTALQPSVTGECAPVGNLGEQLITWTILIASAAAVLSIIGLLPVVGRITSLVVIGAGLAGLAASGIAIAEGIQASGAGSIPWGVWATLAVAAFTAFTGVTGLRGEDQ